jgi:XTP/dITP diphosphohydrolase
MTLDNQQAVTTALKQLMEVVAQLRSPEGGCPWDLAQTPESLTPYVIEEAYEVVDAIKRGDRTEIAEELGDLLLQVVLQAQIASEEGHFTMADIAQGITDKMIRRHPHVFGDLRTNDVEEVKANWAAIKAQEKGQQGSLGLSDRLGRYNRTLPPISSSLKISQKAAQAGLEWENVEGVWEKFEEELAELKEAIVDGDRAHQESELGDLLFTIINLARWYDLDPNEALRGTNQRLIDRIAKIETMIDRPISEYTLGELDALWTQAKAALNHD